MPKLTFSALLFHWHGNRPEPPLWCCKFFNTSLVDKITSMARNGTHTCHQVVSRSFTSSFFIKALWTLFHFPETQMDLDSVVAMRSQGQFRKQNFRHKYRPKSYERFFLKHSVRQDLSKHHIIVRSCIIKLISGAKWPGKMLFAISTYSMLKSLWVKHLWNICEQFREALQVHQPICPHWPILSDANYYLSFLSHLVPIKLLATEPTQNSQNKNLTYPKYRYPPKLPIFRTNTPLRNTGSFTCPLEGPSWSLRYWNST